MLSFRDQVVAPVTWVAAGACWTVQLLLPWTSRGLLSSSSQVEGFHLLRSGVVSSAPDWAAWLVLVLPVTGVALVALASVAGRPATTTRLLLALVGLGALALALHALAGFAPSRLGPGGWTAVAGAALAVAAGVLDRTPGSRPVQLQEAVS